MNETVISLKSDILEISQHLNEFLKKRTTVFVDYEPNLQDFTTTREVWITVWWKKKEAIKFIVPKNRIGTFLGILSNTLFSANVLMITWDIKRLFSYFRYRWPHQINFLSRIIDLKYSEAYMGIEGEKPTIWEEAMKRVGPFIDNKNWCKIHQRIHIPLATDVLPAIETVGLVDTEDRIKKYCYYDIEGQKNGRLSSYKAFEACFLPLNMHPEEKIKFSPGFEKKFMIFDYKHMEASVLQWLSGDEVLRQILCAGQDIYEAIYSIVSGGHPCNTPEKRQLIKNSFLPVVYGAQAKTLAEQLDISPKGAETLISKFYDSFPTAMTWVQEQQDRAKDQKVADYFGRIRSYDKPYIARNAVIQSVAAMICLDKLVVLYGRLKNYMQFIATIHDAYLGVVEDKYLDHVAKEGRLILEAPSDLAPGLRLKVDCKASPDLSQI